MAATLSNRGSIAATSTAPLCVTCSTTSPYSSWPPTKRSYLRRLQITSVQTSHHKVSKWINPSSSSSPSSSSCFPSCFSSSSSISSSSSFSFFFIFLPLFPFFYLNRSEGLLSLFSWGILAGFHRCLWRKESDLNIAQLWTEDIINSTWFSNCRRWVRLIYERYQFQ